MIAWIIFWLGFAAIILWSLGYVTMESKEHALWAKSIQGVFHNQPSIKKDFFKTIHSEMEMFGERIGHPEWVALAYPVSFLLPVFGILIVLILKAWLLIPITLLLFFVPYLWLRSQYKFSRLVLQRQLREVQLLLAYLIKGGAPLAQAVAAAVRVTEFPLKPYLQDVAVATGVQGGDLRAQTVVEAFMDMAKRLNFIQATQFAQLLAQGSKYDTPLSEMMLQSLEIEQRIRNTQAEAVYNAALTKISVLSAVMLGIPTFGYLIFAAMSVMMHLLGGTMFGAVL